MFKELIRRDKSRGKEKCLQEFTYIYHMCSFSSYTEEFNKNDRETEARRAAGLDDSYKPDDKVKAAMDFFRKAEDTRSLRLLRSAYRAADSLEDYFDAVDFTAVDKHGKPVYDANKVMSSIKELGEFIKKLNALEKQVKSELKTGATIAGGHAKHLFEDPD